MPLSTLINDTAALLNDQNFLFTSEKQLLRWINEARRQCADRTGCIRRLVTGQSAFGAMAQPGFAIPGGMQPGALPGAFPMGTAPTNATPVYGAVQNSLMTIPGVERYPYIGFFNPVLEKTYAGCRAVRDAIALSVNWGGVSRPSLDWCPWDDFQARCRAYAVLNTSYPSVWSVYNDGPQGEIWMFPIPSQAGEIELDAYVIPKDVYTDNDFDAIPEDSFYDSLKFLAASLAFSSTYRYQNAQIMENTFADRLGIARVSVDGGKVQSYYATGY